MAGRKLKRVGVYDDNDEFLFEGHFHLWGNEPTNETGDSQTVAIVSDEQGSIHTVRPDQLIFIPK